MRLLRALIALLVCACLAGCSIDLYSNLSEQDTNEIIAELSKAGIRATKQSQDGKVWTVRVAESDLARSLERLKAAALPREKRASMRDLFEKDNLISTPSEERVRFVYAVSEELSRTLSQIDGVVTARVHVVMPANDPLATRIQPSSASVFIKHRANVDLRSLTASIKNLVVKSIEGLTFENVSVSFFPAAIVEDPVLGSVQTTRLMPMSMQDADFTLKDIIYLSFSFIGLVIGSLIAWKLLRRPALAASAAAPARASGSASDTEASVASGADAAAEPPAPAGSTPVASQADASPARSAATVE